MARKRTGPAAASSTPSAGPLPSDLRYSDIDQPSMLRPLAVGAGTGAALIGTLGAMFAHRQLKPALARQLQSKAEYVADDIAYAAKHSYDPYWAIQAEKGKTQLARMTKNRSQLLAAGTAGGGLAGGVGGGLLGAAPGFAYGMKKEREYEEAIKAKGIAAYEKAAEVISGDPDENIIDTSAKHTKSRIGMGAGLGALALAAPAAFLTHGAGNKSLAGLKKLRPRLQEALGMLDQIEPGARQAAEQAMDAAGASGSWKERFAHKLLRGPLPEKLPLKYPAIAAAGAGTLGAGAGAMAGHEYDYGEARALGRTPEEVEVRGHRLRRLAAGAGTGLALGAAHQLIKARKGPPMLDLLEFAPPMMRGMARRAMPEGMSSKIPHPFPTEARVARALGTGAFGAGAGLGYDMGVRSGYDDQETEFDTNSGNRASPLTMFNAVSPVVPMVANATVPMIPSVLKPSGKTMAIGGGIGGLANMIGRIRGRKVSETARGAEKQASVREYGVLFDTVMAGDLGSTPQAALEGISSVSRSPLQKSAASDIFTDGMDEKSRRRRLAELLKRREATGTASGSASPNPPQDS